MFDKYSINVNEDLFRRFVEAIERIAPPPPRLPSPPSERSLDDQEADLISMTDAEYSRVDLQGQLDDLVATLTEKGYAEANKDELAKLTELKARLAEADLESIHEGGDDND